jgi:hypothetical protein
VLLVNPPFAITPMFPLTTTLNRIYACKPCAEGRVKALWETGKSEPDDEPITYAQIVDRVTLHYTLWCCRAEPQHANLWRRYAVWCARQVQHLMTDLRSIEALDVAERYANGEATDQDLGFASGAAGAAVEKAAVASKWAWAAKGAGWADGNPAARASMAAKAARAALACTQFDAAIAADKASEAARSAVAVPVFYSSPATPLQAAAFRQLVTTGTLPDLELKPAVARPESLLSRLRAMVGGKLVTHFGLTSGHKHTLN